MYIKYRLYVVLCEINLSQMYIYTNCTVSKYRVQIQTIFYCTYYVISILLFVYNYVNSQMEAVNCQYPLLRSCWPEVIGINYYSN